MSEVRVIKFNEELFKIPSGTQRKKPDKPIKVKAPRNGSDKTLRNRVLNEIRKNQEKHYHLLMDSGGSNSNHSSSTESFNSDFNQSMEYMNKLANKVKEEKAKNATLRAMPSLAVDSQVVPAPIVPEIVEPNLIPVKLEQVSDNAPIVLKPVPYGCMKVGGTLPTYRTYHNTLKSVAQPIKPEPIKPSVPEPLPEPVQKPMLIAERLVEEKAKQELIEKSKPKHKKVKKLLRRTYRAGKDKLRPRVGVLLSNKTIRSNITTKAYMLKQTPIDEIRKELVKKGFIKHGSSAPNDVLRKIYESVKMIGGEVSNYNADNLLYNFFTDKETAFP